MTRIFLIVLVYGGGVLLFAWLVAWGFRQWRDIEERKTRVPKLVFRDDGELAEQDKRRTLDRVMQANEKPYTAQRAAGFNRNRKKVG